MATISFDDLTNGQIGEIEIATGESITDLFIKGKPGWLLTTARAWLAMRQTKPGLTFAEVRDGNYDLVTDYLESDDPKEIEPGN